MLLDNMSPEQLAEAVRRIAGRAIAEASGRITPATAPAIAASGVDLISVGWLTHSAHVLDIGLDWQGRGEIDLKLDRWLGRPARHRQPFQDVYGVEVIHAWGMTGDARLDIQHKADTRPSARFIIWSTGVSSRRRPRLWRSLA